MILIAASTALTGSQVALWVMGAGSVLIGAYKLLEWLMLVNGISRSPEQKILDSLAEERRMIQEVHGILTDRVFKNAQGDRFEDIATIRGEIERVFKWMKTPPDVATPAFWCRSGEAAGEVVRILQHVEQIRRDESERDAQMEIIIRLLQALATRRIEDGE